MRISIDPKTSWVETFRKNVKKPVSKSGSKIEKRGLENGNTL